MCKDTGSVAVLNVYIKIKMIYNIVASNTQLMNVSNHTSFKKISTKYGSQRFRTKIVTKRNDTRINRYQHFQLQGWRANCDIDVAIDCHSCVEYLRKNMPLKVKTVFSGERCICVCYKNLDDLQNTTKTVKSVMMKALGQRDVSIQEAMHQLL